MAEEHPPSPMHEGVPFAWEIAGQARYDGLGLVLFSAWENLLPEDAAEAAQDAAKAAALLLSATKQGTQHSSQTSCIDAVGLLAFTQKGQQAGSDGSQDAAYRVGSHARLLRDATQHVAEVAAEDVAQDLVAIGQVVAFQVAENVARVDGVVAEGL